MRSAARARRHLVPAAAVLLLGVLAGCTAPDQDEPTTDDAGTSDAAAVSDPGVSTEPMPAEDLTSPEPEPTPTTPVPDLDEVKTAEPDEEQAEAYLEGRVEDGVDPAAVLEAGVEACNRMHYLEVVDAAALRVALTDDGEGGELWQESVTHLCPDLSEFLP